MSNVNLIIFLSTAVKPHDAKRISISLNPLNFCLD